MDVRVRTLLGPGQTVDIALCKKEISDCSEAFGLHEPRDAGSEILVRYK